MNFVAFFVPQSVSELRDRADVLARSRRTSADSVVVERLLIVLESSINLNVLNVVVV